MDEFARMMSMEGVRPLDRPKDKPRFLADQTDEHASRRIGVMPEPERAGHAWVVGQRARVALETAFERLTAEIRDGRRG